MYKIQVAIFYVVRLDFKKILKKFKVNPLINFKNFSIANQFEVQRN